MIETICISSIILIIFLSIMIIRSQILNIELFNVKIEESSKNINMLQEEAINLLTKFSKKVKIDSENKIFKNLTKIKNKSLDMFELDKDLNDLNNELKDILEYNKIELTEENVEILNNYRDNKIELSALKLYYNNNVEKYNSYIKSIKRLLIKLIKKLKTKELFIIEKEIEFEILKNKK